MVAEANLGERVVYPGVQDRDHLTVTEMEHREVLLEQPRMQEQAIQLEGRLGRGLTQKEKKREVVGVITVTTEGVGAEEVERELTCSGALLVTTL
jgi:hypothetical protein